MGLGVDSRLALMARGGIIAAMDDGDASVLQKLGATMVDFELGFEILPGTKGPTQEEGDTKFQVEMVDQAGLGDG